MALCTSEPLRPEHRHTLFQSIWESLNYWITTLNGGCDVGDLGHCCLVFVHTLFSTQSRCSSSLNNWLIVFMYTPPCISLCLFMKNNTLSIFLLMLLLMLLIIIQLLTALLCYTLAYCMHSYTSCSSEQTVSSLKENKVRKQFMMKEFHRLIYLVQIQTVWPDKNVPTHISVEKTFKIVMVSGEKHPK